MFFGAEITFHACGTLLYIFSDADITIRVSLMLPDTRHYWSVRSRL